MGVTHLSLDLGARHQGGDWVDDQGIDSSGADECFGDLECFLARIGLRDVELVDIHTTYVGVRGVECVLDIDDRGSATHTLRLGDDVQIERSLAGSLWPIDLGDATTRYATDAQRDVQRQGTGRYRLYVQVCSVAQFHHRSLAETLANGIQCSVECFLTPICHLGLSLHPR